nr:hypothetical protein [Tanacetum cinerariifolium]
MDLASQAGQSCAKICGTAGYDPPQMTVIIRMVGYDPPQMIMIFGTARYDPPQINVKAAAPTKVSDDEFLKVTRKHWNGKHAAKTRHIDGVGLTKPKPNYYYCPISKSANVNGEGSISLPKETNVSSTPQPNNKGKDVSDLPKINIITLHNSFDALIEKNKILKASNDVGSRKADSPKRIVVFSLETNVHYFDGDDIEEVEHENAYSKKGL